MNEHTPEPWRFDDPEIVGADGYRIAEMIAWKHGPSQCSEGQDNWRRILACVNACAGMEDPEQEISEIQTQLQEALAAIENQKDFISTLKAQRDELLAAAKAFRSSLYFDRNTEQVKRITMAAVANPEKGKP